VFIIFTIAHARTRSTICEIARALSLSLTVCVCLFCVDLVRVCDECVCDGVCVSVRVMTHCPLITYGGEAGSKPGVCPAPTSSHSSSPTTRGR